MFQKLQEEQSTTIEINKLELEKEAILARQQAQIEANKEKNIEAVDATVKAEIDAENKKIKVKDKLQKIIMKNEDSIRAAVLETKEIQKAGQVRDGISNAYIMAQEAYKAMAKIPFVGPALGVAAAATAFAYGMKQVDGIKKAQYGADFVTDGPQLILAGEGNGPERVQITPLVDENREGPQGQGITLNINNPIMTDSFVEDSVVPQIREALRMGENLGA